MDKKLTWVTWGLLFSGFITPAVALNYSLGQAGIDAHRLQKAPYNLLGRKIGIGQVEIGRPGKFGKDKLNSRQNYISPKAVFFRNQPATPNNNVDEHASMVAGTIIAQDKRLSGVAPAAKLYSSAIGSLKQGGQALECLASQHIAQQNSGDIRAINFSFGESLEHDPRLHAQLDGKALLTKCIDWSAKNQDVLYVIAGNQGTGGFRFLRIILMALPLPILLSVKENLLKLILPTSVPCPKVLVGV